MAATLTMSVKDEAVANDTSTDDLGGIAPNQQLPLSANLRMPQQPSAAYRLADEVHGVTGIAGLETTPPAALPVPIPHQNSVFQPSHAAPSSGPMSTTVVIPPRPRPGRKPMQQEDAADRRRLQNRIAQRNFRDKRQQKLVETQQELDDRRRDYQDRINDLTRELERLRQDTREKTEQSARQVRAAEVRAQAAEARAQQMELRMKQEQQAASLAQAQQMTVPVPPLSLSVNTTHHPANYGPSVPTPPEDNFQEIDFTNYYSRSTNPKDSLYSTHSHDSIDMNDMDIDPMNIRPEESCGFCSDDSNCMCAVVDAETKRQAIAPGNCDACRTDPQRAQACRALAERTHILSGPQASHPPHSSYDGVTGNSLPPLRISCSNFLDRTVQQGERLSSISELFGASLHAIPSRSGQGYEIEEHEAAQALSKLANSRRRTSSRHDSNGGIMIDDNEM